MDAPYNSFPHVFSGNPLNRSVGSKKDPNFVSTILSAEGTVAIIYFSRPNTGGKILCYKQSKKVHICFLSISEVLAWGGFESVSELERNAIVVLLGQQADGHWMVAIDTEHLKADAINSSMTLFAGSQNENLCIVDGRYCMIHLGKEEEAAIAGQALAFCNWHRKNVYDGVTGKPTASTESGLKRKVIDNLPGAKLYPRIDPVVICLVISPCGGFVLLGKMKRSPKNFYSCISGFIEPCESIQEAAKREVWEETGIDISAVRVVDSQPWPIGRGGGCELMIGCTAIAKHMNITITEDDVEDIKWFTLLEVRTMLQTSILREVTPNGFDVPGVPGNYAIAHHLLQHAISGDCENPSSCIDNNISNWTGFICLTAVTAVLGCYMKSRLRR